MKVIELESAPAKVLGYGHETFCSVIVLYMACGGRSRENYNQAGELRVPATSQSGPVPVLIESSFSVHADGVLA